MTLAPRVRWTQTVVSAMQRSKRRNDRHAEVPSQAEVAATNHVWASLLGAAHVLAQGRECSFWHPDLRKGTFHP